MFPNFIFYNTSKIKFFYKLKQHFTKKKTVSFTLNSIKPDTSIKPVYQALTVVRSLK